MAKAKGEKIARQSTIPGMEDAKIKEIEESALDYADGRDERMAATEKEVELKGNLIAAMHKHGKTSYKRGRISVVLSVEKEKVKVRIKEPGVEVEVSEQQEAKTAAVTQ